MSSLTLCSMLIFWRLLSQNKILNSYHSLSFNHRSYKKLNVINNSKKDLDLPKILSSFSRERLWKPVLLWTNLWFFDWFIHSCIKLRLSLRTPWVPKLPLPGPFFGIKFLLPPPNTTSSPSPYFELMSCWAGRSLNVV